MEESGSDFRCRRLCGYAISTSTTSLPVSKSGEMHCAASTVVDLIDSADCNHKQVTYVMRLWHGPHRTDNQILNYKLHPWIKDLL